MKPFVYLLPVLALTPIVAFAEDDKSFSMDAELGGLVTSGNTNSTSFKAKVDVKKDFVKWRNNYVAEAIYKEDEVDASNNSADKQTTAEKYGFLVQADYKLNEKHRGLFVLGSYEEDRFSGYDYQGALAAGYTDRILKTDSAEWNYSIGLGSSFTRTEDVYSAEGVWLADGESESSAIVRASFDYRYSFSKNTKFTQTFSSDIATDSGANTKTKAESAFTSNLNEHFALRVSLSITNNSEVPENIESTDKQMAVALVYSL